MAWTILRYALAGLALFIGSKHCAVGPFDDQGSDRAITASAELLRTGEIVWLKPNATLQHRRFELCSPEGLSGQIELMSNDGADMSQWFGVLSIHNPDGGLLGAKLSIGAESRVVLGLRGLAPFCVNIRVEPLTFPGEGLLALRYISNVYLPKPVHTILTSISRRGAAPAHASSQPRRASISTFEHRVIQFIKTLDDAPEPSVMRTIVQPQD